MLVELVKVQTTDGVRLDGAWNKAATLNSNQDSSGKESKSLVLVCMESVVISTESNDVRSRRSCC